MSWFTRTPRPPDPDPIGEICKSLVERWWEWKDATTRPNPVVEQITQTIGLYHEHGNIFVTYSTSRNVWLGSKIGALSVPVRDAERLYRAIQGHYAARLHPKPTFDDTATALAHAVIAKDGTAMRALSDRIQELREAGEL